MILNVNLVSYFKHKTKTYFFPYNQWIILPTPNLETTSFH